MPPSDHSATDHLLSEYVKVINAKDAEIHRLLTEVQTVQLDAKKKEDRYKSRLRELKHDVDHFNSLRGEEAQEMARLNSDNALLSEDIGTLRAALQKSDEQLQALVKASNKAQKHEAHARSALEEQVRQLMDSEKEATRWKVEFQRMQHEAAETHRVIKELKKRNKETSLTIQQASDETLRANRTDLVVADLRTKISEQQRQIHDLELAVAHEKLQRAQSVEEYRFEYSSELKLLKERADKMYHEKATLEGETIVLRQHIADLESSARSSAKTFQEAEQAAMQEAKQLRQKLSDAQIDAETTKRMCSQHEAALSKAQTKLDSAREEAAKLHTEIQRAEDVVARQVATIAHNERLLDEGRGHLFAAQTEASTERNTALRKDQEWRNKVTGLDELLRSKDEEKRQIAEHFENTLRQRENDFHMEKNLRSRELQKAQSDISVMKHLMEDRFSSVESRADQFKSELTTVKEEYETKLEKEKVLVANIKQQDDFILKLQLDLSERDACIVTLRRNLTAVTSTHRTVEESYESASSTLESERRKLQVMEQKAQAYSSALVKKDEEVQELSRQVRRVEELTRAHDAELRRELEQARERVQQLTADCHAAQQQGAVHRIELERLQARHADERASLQRDVLGPLQSRVDVLISANAKFSRDSHDSEARIAELTRLNGRLQDQLTTCQGETAAKERRLTSLTEEVETSKEQLLSARRLQSNSNTEKEEHRRTRADLESLLRKAGALEQQVALLTKELSDFKNRDFDLTHELNTKKAELAMVKERHANLESLKVIHESTVHELQLRERELVEKLEEMRSAQQMMQLCFDKQQEQLEVGRRMHGDDASTSRSASRQHTASVHHEEQLVRRKIV